MQSKVFFLSYSGTNYELTVECNEAQKIPTILSEAHDGLIYDLGGADSWKSLADMTQDLKIEITSWGSDIGD